MKFYVRLIVPFVIVCILMILIMLSKTTFLPKRESCIRKFADAYMETTSECGEKVDLEDVLRRISPRCRVEARHSIVAFDHASTKPWAAVFNVDGGRILLMDDGTLRLNSYERVEVTDAIPQNGNSRCAPRQPPEGPSPAKPGSAPQ